MAQNLRIIFVDDYDTVRVLFHKYLTDLGIDQIVDADNGKTALQKIQEAHAAQIPFDLVFCDWNMPIMNGLELLNTLRKDPKFSKLPFVMVTANSDESEVVEAMRAGVSEYLVKPFDTKSLGRTIQRVIERYKKVA
jgi:two-component system chemotaxis response regulator CheY